MHEVLSKAWRLAQNVIAHEIHIHVESNYV